MEQTQEQELLWFLRSSNPVTFPSHDALRLPQDEFDRFIRNDLHSRHQGQASAPTGDVSMTDDDTKSENFTLITNSTSAEIRKGLDAMDVGSEPNHGTKQPSLETAGASNPFMDGLLGSSNKSKAPVRNMEKMMFTENSDVAYRSTTSALVDLFSELEQAVSGPRLRDLLEPAWTADPLVTLKIIFNSRSIHLGKSSRNTFYRCAGWLARNHPHTLVVNLRWLSRPVIDKKVQKVGEGENDAVIVDHPEDEQNASKFDVRNGVSHGYWKDLINILALAVNNKLDVLADPRDVLNSENRGIIRGKTIKRNKSGNLRGRGGRGRARGISRRGKVYPAYGHGGGRSSRRGAPRGRGLSRGRPRLHYDPLFPGWHPPAPALPDSRGPLPWNQPGEDAENASDCGNDVEPEDTQSEEEETEPAKKLSDGELRRQTRQNRHEAAIEAFNTDPVYRALHLTIARLFAEQLQADLKAMRGPDPRAKRNISLCGKWAPSSDRFHDKHTFITSSIAEILYPRDFIDEIKPTDDRETYLRYAREEYRKDISALRKHLEVVERDITTKTYENIKYDRVPSLAMNNYSKLFAQNDMGRFEGYLDRVAEGKANISGATLLPSTMIYQASQAQPFPPYLFERERSRMPPSQLIEHKMRELEQRALDGQWNALVQRIKDSGILESSIAICDVSGSMSGPRFHDKTVPLHSSIGLSLLVAEVTKPPFGGCFITFSSSPQVQRVDLTKSLTQKYHDMVRSPWHMSTDFVAVFERLILPMALENNLKQEDMVKRVFVFSDMHFNGCGGGPRWTTSYERIKKLYKDAGYEMPELVFWNLAAGRVSFASMFGDATAPKPVTVTDEGTSLVNGYSQGMLKVFLENGSFDDPGEESEDEIVVTKDDKGVVTMESAKKRVKMDPMKVVKKAIGQKAYDMLEVMD